MGNDLRVPGRPDGLGLPSGLTSFVGRTDELARLEMVLGRHRLTTVVGPAGSGKTRLAVEAANRLAVRFEDGVYMVELAQIDAPELVGPMVAAGLKVAEHQGLSMAEAVASVAGRRHLLLVLDNCEHVIAAAAAVCQALLAAGDDLRILATSREALGVPGEARFALGPLAVPVDDDEEMRIEDNEAVILFADRAAQADTTFEMTPASAGPVAALVRHLDGMPLAIELAAAQLDVLTLDDLTVGLADRFGVLVSRSRGVPARQASLTAAVEWSYRLLDLVEQRAFRRLSIFSASFTVAAAEAAAGPDAPALVARLVRRSMLVPHGRGPDGRSRYTMLETLRAYGAKLLDESGERLDASCAVASWTLSDAERAAASFDSPDDAPIGWWGDAEQENIRDALEWFLDHDPPSALRLGVAVSPWWFLRGLLREGRSQLGRSTAACAGGEPDQLLRGEIWIGRLALYSGDFSGALEHFAVADRLLAGAGSCALLVDSLNGQAIALNNLGRTAAASDVAARALHVARTIGYRSGEVYARSVAAMGALYVGDLATVVALMAPTDQVTDSGVSGHTARWATNICGVILSLSGDTGAAEVILTETLQECRRVGDRSWAATQLDTLARLELATGRPGAAAVDVEEAIRIAFDIGDLLRLADCFATVSVWARSASPESAAVLWGAYRGAANAIGWSPLPLAEIADQADPGSIWDSEFVTPPMLEIRERLGIECARQADERGAGMPREAAVDFALALLAEPRFSAGDGHWPGPTISRREREVLGLVAEGLTDGQIAEKMFISIRTVRSHLDRIRDKTGCRRRAELTRFALSNWSG